MKTLEDRAKESPRRLSTETPITGIGSAQAQSWQKTTTCIKQKQNLTSQTRRKVDGNKPKPIRFFRNFRGLTMSSHRSSWKDSSKDQGVGISGVIGSCKLPCARERKKKGNRKRKKRRSERRGMRMEQRVESNGVSVTCASRRTSPNPAFAGDRQRQK